MRTRIAVSVALCLGIGELAQAQSHPRAILSDAAIVARIEAKRAGSDADWLAFKTACDRSIGFVAGTPDNLPPVFASREPLVNQVPGQIIADYQGTGYRGAVFALTVCYLGLLDTDPTTAAKYKAQILKVLRKGAVPFASIAPATPPAAWQGITSRAAWYVSNTGPGGQARVFMNGHSLLTGDTITVSGVTGCTNANGTRKVGARTAGDFMLTDTGGSAIICEGAGTNYNHNFASDAGFPIRTFGYFLPLGYDWFYSDLTSDEKTNIYNTVNAAYDEFRVVSPSYVGRVQSNYHVSYSAAIAFIGILTKGSGENPRGQEIYDRWHDTVHELQDKAFYQRWLGNSGGFPEGIRYEATAVYYALALKAQLDANAENLVSGGLTFITDLMKYHMHSTMPPRTYRSSRGYVAYEDPVNAWSAEIGWMAYFWGKLNSHPLVEKYKDWIDEQVVINGGYGPDSAFNAWSRLVFYDAADASTDWTTETPSLCSLSNPDGECGRVLARSDWTTSAVFWDLYANPYTSDAGNGKERLDKGSLVVQRGDVTLLSFGTAESAREGNLSAYNAYHLAGGTTAEDEVYSQWYVQPSTGGSFVLQGYSFAQAYRPPGYVDSYPTTVITQHPSRIERFADTGTYVLAEAVGLHYNYKQAALGDTPMQGWTRTVLYLRPKVLIVYDQTYKQNKTTGTLVNYNNIMGWMVGKTPVIAAYGSGMHRAEVSDGATYKGALTFVRPSMPTPTSYNFGSFGTAYHVRTEPDTEGQDYTNWMTVIDAADSQANLAEVARFSTSSNIDAMRLGTDTVVAFPNQQYGAALAFPMTYTMAGMGAGVTHYICGLASSTTYKRTVSGNDVTLASSGGGTDTTSSAAGCATFTSGSVANPPVVVDTTDPMPSGTVGTAYSQCLAASGGDGGPYTYAVDSGALPAGTSLTSGCITGTPTTANTYNFAITANDGTDTSAAKSLSIVIAANPVTITTTNLANAIEDQAYSAQICASGGSEPYVWDTTPDTGALCDGLSISSGSPCATISGTPTTVQLCSFTVDLTDDDAQTDDQALTIQVAAANLTLGVRVNAGSNAAVVVFGAAGIPNAMECTVSLYDGVVLHAQNTETMRSAIQRSSFRGLDPEKIYGASATCPNIASPGIVSFTTKPLEASIATTVGIRLKAPSIYPTVTQVTVDYGIDSTAENTTTVACASGCTVPLSLVADVYLYKYTWKNAGGTALATSNTRELIVP